MARDGLAVAYSMKRRMAKGGEVKGVHKSAEYMPIKGSESNRFNKPLQGASEARLGGKDSEKDAHRKVLGEMKSMPGPATGKAGFAHGGMVDRIMAKRKCYSEGGVVANEGDQAEADEMPAEFDDLALDDHLEGHEHADGPGSDLNQEKGDMIDRIMRKRRG